MEEEKNLENLEKPENEIHKKKFKFCDHGHCGCNGHKIVRVFLMAIIVLAIFMLGVSTGAHLNRGEYALKSKYRSNFEQNDRLIPGRRMMPPIEKFQTDDNSCPMRGATSGASVCPMQGAAGRVNGSGACQFQAVNQESPVKINIPASATGTKIK